MYCLPTEPAPSTAHECSSEAYLREKLCKYQREQACLVHRFRPRCNAKFRLKAWRAYRINLSGGHLGRIETRHPSRYSVRPLGKPARCGKTRHENRANRPADRIFHPNRVLARGNTASLIIEGYVKALRGHSGSLRFVGRKRFCRRPKVNRVRKERLRHGGLPWVFS